VRIGLPREIKDGECRAGLTPAGVAAIVAAGHAVCVERGAGAGSGFADADYRDAGAGIGDTAAAWDAQLVVKVKELQPPEFALARRGQILFCYQHLAPEPALLEALLNAGTSCIAYETVGDGRDGLPLLAPMSQIAGRLAPLMGAEALQIKNGGSGVLLPGAPGVPAGEVLIIGAGHSGANACHVALGLGCRVTVMAGSRPRLDALERAYGAALRTARATPELIAGFVPAADLVIGAVLRPGRLSPKLISRNLLRRMRPGSALVDIGIDQGGIAETSRPSSHSQPFYIEEGVVHYCVPNMPAACARSATLALSAATLPYVLSIAASGLAGAIAADPGLGSGLQLHQGRVTCAKLAQDTGRPHGAYDALTA
jgi:alanine dehydrogenase